MPKKTKEKEPEPEIYLNPKAKKMCEMCYDKDKCEQLPEDLLFCKLNHINMTLVKILRKLEEK